MKQRLITGVIASLACIVVAVALYFWRYPGISGGILITCAACALVGSFGLLWFAPKLQLVSMSGVTDPKDKFHIENEARQMLATIVGASFFLFSGYAAWSNFEMSLNKDRAERLSKSLEMLESDKPSTKVAGANSLAALARQFTSKDEYTQAVRVKNDTVQQHSTILGKQPADPGHCGLCPAPAPEIQRLLKFLGNRCTPSSGFEDRLTFDDVDLRGAYMGNASHGESGGNCEWVSSRDSQDVYAGKWAYASFYGSDLSAATFTRANLSNAQFAPSIYTGEPARLSTTCVQLVGEDKPQSVPTVFSHADLHKANFFRAQMQGAVLICADASNASFPEANLAGASLMCADLKDANLTGADLSGIDMSRTLCVTPQQLASAKQQPAVKPRFDNCPAQWNRESCDISPPKHGSPVPDCLPNLP